jgi:hypothetical protein
MGLRSNHVLVKASKGYLLTNATVVDDAIRFVSSKTKETLKSSTEGDKEESNEPDYDEDEN